MFSVIHMSTFRMLMSISAADGIMRMLCLAEEDS